MRVAAFIAKRIAFNRQKSFSRFIIRLSIIATAISVAVMIITLAMVSGFQEVVSQKVFSFWGHIRVQHFEPTKVSIAEELPISKNDTVEYAIVQHEAVQVMQPFATKYAILKKKNAEDMEGVLVKGVEKEYNFKALDQFLRAGHWPAFPDSGYSQEITISDYTSQQLEVSTGDTVVLFFMQSNNAPPRARQLRVAGIFKTGIEEYDKSYAIGDLRLIQRLNNWKADEIGGYELFLKDYQLMDSINLQIYASLPELWNSRTMKEIYPNIFDWLHIQSLNKVVVIVIMTIVAIINMITCLIILALERTRMIGVLKATGMSNWSIQKIFLMHGAIITIAGIGLGMIIGLGLCFLQLHTGFIALNEEAYYMAKAPVNVIWWQVAAVGAGTFLTCCLTLLIPTLVVRMIQPVKAIQFR